MSILATTNPIIPDSSRSIAPSGELTSEFISALRRNHVMDDTDRARHNAVSNNPLDSLALNRDALRRNDGHFSHRIKPHGITDQKQSGRCWMFAGLNVLRPKIIREHQMEDFRFSTAYLQFWDKIEKSNLYLESIIELRGASCLDRDWEIVNRHAVEEGGWWNYLVGLVRKYGVVPLSVMPETHSSSNTRILNHILSRLLRVHAARMISMHEDGAGIEALREAKGAGLQEIYRFLAISLGEPPDQFEWRYQIRSAPKDTEAPGGETHQVENGKLSPLESHTPRSFYEKYVGDTLGEFVCLYNDPHSEMDRHYYFDRARNIVGAECMHFVNIAASSMKEIAKASILADEPVWFAVNMDIDQSVTHGLMENQLFDYETLFGMNLTISKSDRIRFHAGVSNHAMVLMGVDLDKDGRPRKWLVENSHGDGGGDKGRWTILDSWFDEHVYTVIVHRRHVPDAILKRFAEQPTALPAWYPGAEGIRFPENP